MATPTSAPATPTYEDLLGPFADALEAAGFASETLRPFEEEGFDATLRLGSSDFCLVAVRYEHPSHYATLHHFQQQVPTTAFEDQLVATPAELLGLLRAYAPLATVLAG